MIKFSVSIFAPYGVDAPLRVFQFSLRDGDSKELRALFTFLMKELGSHFDVSEEAANVLDDLEALRQWTEEQNSEGTATASCCGAAATSSPMAGVQETTVLLLSSPISPSVESTSSSLS